MTQVFVIEDYLRKKERRKINYFLLIEKGKNNIREERRNDELMAGAVQKVGKIQLKSLLFILKEIKVSLFVIICRNKRRTYLRF